MPKKTTILIVILALITGILIFLAVRSDQTQQIMTNLNPKPSPTVEVVKPYATLSFLPEKLDVSLVSPVQSIDVVIDTGDKPVAGAQVELSYDPKLFTNVSITQPKQSPFFGPNPTILINSVDATQGRISYAVGISPDGSEKTGKGSIMTLNFTANKFAGVTTAQIAFLPKSAVTTLSTSGSILKTSIPLQVILANVTQ